MALLSPAERERHTHVGFLDMPIAHPHAIDLDHGHQVAEPRAHVVRHAGVTLRVNVDLGPPHALVGTHLKQQLTRVITQMTRGPRIEDDSLLHTATLGPWSINSAETLSIDTNAGGNG